MYGFLIITSRPGNSKRENSQTTAKDIERSTEASELELKKEKLREVIDATLKAYDREVKAIRSEYEPRLQNMVEDYRLLQRSIECAKCSKFKTCESASRFDGYHTED